MKDIGDISLAEFSSAIVERDNLMKAATKVCWFDWSQDNDADALAAIDALREVVLKSNEYRRLKRS